MGLDMYLSADVKLGDRDKRALAVFEVIAREYPEGTAHVEFGEATDAISLCEFRKADRRALAVKEAIANHFPVTYTENSWIGAEFTGSTITIPLYYWRKANQIHAWFVREVQDGKDECERTEVPREKLADLAKRIGEIVNDHSKAGELLPSREGFFFGSTDYHKYYFEGLKATAQAFDRMRKCGLTEATTIYYCSSW